MPQALQSIVEQVRFSTLVDIGLTAVLIYWLFSLIRGTRAVRLVIGVTVLFAVYAAARVFNLQLLRQILETGAIVGVFALVVVFQPELRRALERIGRVGSLAWLVSPPDERSVEHVAAEVARAAAVLAGQGHGALIVIERETGLEEIAESGRDGPRRRLGRPAGHDLRAPDAAPRRGGHRPRRADRRGRRAPPAGRDHRPVGASRDPPSGGPRASPSRPTRWSWWSARRAPRSAWSSARGSCATSTRPSSTRAIVQLLRPGRRDARSSSGGPARCARSPWPAAGPGHAPPHEPGGPTPTARRAGAASAAAVGARVSARRSPPGPDAPDRGAAAPDRAPVAAPTNRARSPPTIRAGPRAAGTPAMRRFAASSSATGRSSWRRSSWRPSSTRGSSCPRAPRSGPAASRSCRARRRHRRSSSATCRRSRTSATSRRPTSPRG